ncbi:hypothetical protein L2E82_38402 [Cichorium intybus]|uniref:Uncharacterized protein n=1 Tax=Cichorium intybus TaxID=13427 RepID=A0ACB9AHM7_CICIN|nr:hypothetical protein L2E82_38402 [Cichorium intybus]
MAGVDEAVVKFVNGEIKNSISTVIEPYAVDTDSKEKLIGSCNLDMVSSDSGTDCFWFTMTGQEQYFDFRFVLISWLFFPGEEWKNCQCYKLIKGLDLQESGNVSISLGYSFGTVLKEMKTLQKVWIWVCESEYGEDEGNCSSLFQLKKHISAEGKVNNVVKDKNEVYQCFISQHQFGFDAVWLVDFGESELECEIPFMVLAFVKSNQFKNSPNKAKCHACEIVNTY